MKGGGRKICDFKPVSQSQKWCKIGVRLLLITNRKLYMGFQLAPRAMTLDDLEH